MMDMMVVCATHTMVVLDATGMMVYMCLTVGCDRYVLGSVKLTLNVLHCEVDHIFIPYYYYI